MGANDPTGHLAGEPYGFPNGEPEEGKPGPLPRRKVGATLSREDHAQLLANRAANERETNR